MSAAEPRIRHATATDAFELGAIAAASPGAPQWSPQQFLALLASRERTGPVRRAVLVANERGRIAGFATVSALCAVSPAEAELESIAVLPDVRGKGIGRALLRSASEWAVQHTAGVLRLEVRESNLPALHLYHAAGFVTTGKRRGYYTQPAEDAICMEAPILLLP